jgi:hypothetical protein
MRGATLFFVKNGRFVWKTPILIIFLRKTLECKQDGNSTILSRGDARL